MRVCLCVHTCVYDIPDIGLESELAHECFPASPVHCFYVLARVKCHNVMFTVIVTMTWSLHCPIGELKRLAKYYYQ